MSAKRLFSVCGDSLIVANRLRHIVPLVPLLVFACTVVQAAAQEFKSDPVDEKAGRNRAIAQQCVKDPTIYANNMTKFDDYFDNYHFPEMTRPEPEKLAELGKLRDEIFKYFLWKTSNAQLQSDLTDRAFKAMGKIVQDASYHPAVRYNAILVIGMLDEKYSDGHQPPKPLPKATKALTIVVDMAATSNRFPPPVILGAVIGLERHAQFPKSLGAEAVSAMSAALVKLVMHDEPIQEMDPDAYAWLRLRAASVLAKLGNTGENNVVHLALIHLISTSKSLDDRCEVAAMLDKITYKDAKLDTAGTAEPLFALAREVAAAEDKRAQDFQDQYGGGGGVRTFPRIGPEGVGPGAIGTASDELETYPRRQVLARLTGLRNALATVKPALPADTQKKIDDLLKAIDPARAAAASKDTVELKLAEAIRTMALAINKAVPPPDKAPAEKADETFGKPPAAVSKP